MILTTARLCLVRMRLATNRIADGAKWLDHEIRENFAARQGLMARTWIDGRMTGHAVLAAICLLTCVAYGAPSQDHAPEPAGYRLDDYRAPTPATLAGAGVLTTAEAKLCWENGAVFVDVLAHSPRPANLPSGTIWREKMRRDIPGSVWLANTGYGELAAETENYFRRGLERVTQGDGAKLLVFYCLRDCWMSWNAAKRALALGYKNVAWYPDGTDGWEAAGLPLQEAKPESANVQ
jgi:PQQ-dependent catabolism-associated CXXCW motif protein